MKVVRDALFDLFDRIRLSAPTVDLRPAGNPRLDAMADEIALRHLLVKYSRRIAFERGVLRAAGRSIGAIAKALGRPECTVSRELFRNSLASGRYSPLHAAGAYMQRRRREAALERDERLRGFVRDRLAEGWSPEQISGWLKQGNERRLRPVACETIYAFVYRAAQKAEALWRYLARRHKRRKPTKARPSRDTIKDRASIHDRPQDVESRAEAGHWEGRRLSVIAALC